MTTQPILIEVSPQGDISLNAQQVKELGFASGDTIQLLPLDDGQYLLHTSKTPELTPVELSEMLQTSFSDAGYDTEESIIQLVRDVKQEMTQSL